MYHLILPLLLKLPVCYADRDLVPEVKRAQLETVARAVATVAKNASEAALLVSVAWHESRLCLEAHRGGNGPAYGLWQIEPASNLPRPYAGLSYPETESAARSALYHLRHSYQCGPSVGDRITAYAGRPCGQVWPTLESRVRMYYWVRSKLT